MLFVQPHHYESQTQYTTLFKLSTLIFRQNVQDLIRTPLFFRITQHQHVFCSVYGTTVACLVIRHPAGSVGAQCVVAELTARHNIFIFGDKALSES
jgi:hypothetical protein